MPDNRFIICDYIHYSVWVIFTLTSTNIINILNPYYVRVGHLAENDFM